jgi:hypothetical protein
MGLEEVRIVQTLNFQGGKTPSPVCTRYCTQKRGQSATAPFLKNMILLLEDRYVNELELDQV